MSEIDASLLEPQDSSVPSPKPPSRSRVRGIVGVALWIVLVLGLGAGVGALVFHFTHHGASTSAGAVPPPARSYTFVVPPGTAAKQAQGVKAPIMPEELDMKVGEHLVIRNDDVRLVSVGPYAVDAGQTLDVTMQYPGIVQGFCSLQPNGRLRIVITK